MDEGVGCIVGGGRCLGMILPTHVIHCVSIFFVVVAGARRVDVNSESPGTKDALTSQD